jgi:hypothetical protein
MTNQQAANLRIIAKAVLDGVRAAGDRGAPAGVLYAALMHWGCTLNQFTGIMAGMVKAQIVRQDGLIYFEGVQAARVDAMRTAS